MKATVADPAANYKYGNAHVTALNNTLQLTADFPKLFSHIHTSNTDSSEQAVTKFFDDLLLAPLSANVTSEQLLVSVLKILIATKGSVKFKLYQNLYVYLYNLLMFVCHVGDEHCRECGFILTRGKGSEISPWRLQFR